MNVVEETEPDLYTVLMQAAKESLPELRKLSPDKPEKELINIAMREGLTLHKEMVEEELRKEVRRK